MCLIYLYIDFNYGKGWISIFFLESNPSYLFYVQFHTFLLVCFDNF